MNHAGETTLSGYPVELIDRVAPGAVNLWAGGDARPRRALAIVGSHPATRDNAPWNDDRFDIWLFNESAQKPEVYKRWDALLQIHEERVYASPTNWVNANHWEWLQQRHGKPIYMQRLDPRVPDSVEYPLEGVLSLVPFRYLRSSPAMALALGIYLGYKEIWLYGSELTSSTEYSYQATNYAFWIGVAVGRGVDLHLECWQAEFTQPIYGYEGELQIDREYYQDAAADAESEWRAKENILMRLKSRLDDATLSNGFEKAAELSLQVETAAQEAGQARAMLSEFQRYSEREDMISRQEFERRAGHAQLDADKLRYDKDHEGGKCEYVWNLWRQTGNNRALAQFREFVKAKNQYAYAFGEQLGIYTANTRLAMEYDKRLQAAGGVRALGRQAA